MQEKSSFDIISSDQLDTIVGGLGVPPPPGIGQLAKNLQHVDWKQVLTAGNNGSATGRNIGTVAGAVTGLIVGSETGPFDLAVALKGAQIGGTAGGVMGWIVGAGANLNHQLQH